MPTPPLHLLCATLGLRAYAGDYDLSDLGRTVIARIYGVDGLGVGVVPFGFVSKGTIDGLTPVLATVRGTQMPDGSIVEWLDDFEAWLEDCPLAPGAKWHHGFGAVYKSLYAVSEGGTEHVPLGAFLATLPGCVAHGHSLGGPLATYASLEAKLSPPVLFATPKAGDSAFRDAVQSVCAGVPVSYQNTDDAVPRVPLTVDFPWHFEDFQQVAPFTALQPNLVTPPIPSDWGSAHSLASYLTLLHALP